MRTNTLLLTVALGVASAATSMAQVYSVNSVGYININLKRGLNLVANQLVQSDKSIRALLTGLPDATYVYKFTAGNGPNAGYNIELFDSGDWDPGSGNGTTTWDNGGGLFILVESDVTITLVGEVAQGNLSTPLVSGLQIVSSRVPQAGRVTTDLNLVAQDADYLYKHGDLGGGARGYTDIVLFDSGAWDGGEPSLAVGEAIFYLSDGPHTPATWARSFTVN